VGDVMRKPEKASAGKEPRTRRRAPLSPNARRSRDRSREEQKVATRLNSPELLLAFSKPVLDYLGTQSSVEEVQEILAVTGQIWNVLYDDDDVVLERLKHPGQMDAIRVLHEKHGVPLHDANCLVGCLTRSRMEQYRDHHFDFVDVQVEDAPGGTFKTTAAVRDYSLRERSAPKKSGAVSMPRTNADWIQEIELAWQDASDAKPFGPLVDAEVTDRTLFHLAPHVAMKFRRRGATREDAEQIVNGALANYVANTEKGAPAARLLMRSRMAFAFCYVAAHLVMGLLDEERAGELMSICVVAYGGKGCTCFRTTRMARQHREFPSWHDC
jgi:hypothetical protein